jgi:hypothetical protein
LAAVALIRLGSTEPELPRRFRVWEYPWTPLIFAKHMALKSLGTFNQELGAA